MTYDEKHEQARRLYLKQNGICPICKKGIMFYGSQRAHRVPQYKRHYKKWGKAVDSDLNIDLVCSLECNKKAQLPRWQWDSFMENVVCQ